MTEQNGYAAKIRGLKPTYGHGPDIHTDLHERGYYAARNDAALIGDEADAEIERLKDEVTRLRGPLDEVTRPRSLLDSRPKMKRMTDF
jgi:hypothetical protein